MQLEGPPPEVFKGDRDRTGPFLAQFKGFMRMNASANIAKKNRSRGARNLLSLIKGPKVKGWGYSQRDWLERVKANPTILP